jgi:phosphoribosyl-ATP pyrophosphohydrolase/phosphoribosyl-AMP cyclohydrolase
MIIPSIDLMNGKAVQLINGEKKRLEESDLNALITRFAPFGEIALIDLDAAMDNGSNRELIKQLLRQIPDARVGGGIRRVKDARELIWQGANKIIVGSAVFNKAGIDSSFLAELVAAVGKERLVAALDVKNGTIHTAGWKQDSGLTLKQVIPLLQPYFSEFLITQIDREGTMKGLDRDFWASVRQLTSLPLTIAGGVKNAEDVRLASALDMNVQLGMSLYTGALPVENAFLASLDFEKSSLLPAVVQDVSGTVLMLAYCNKQALQQTFQSGWVTFFSRSRHLLWTKGETSGNRLRFLKIRTDCDNDALIITAEPLGPVCHRGTYSCFQPQRYNFDRLEQVLARRLENPQPESYTATLSENDIYAKILEEAGEVVEAESIHDTIWEAADVMFFVTLLLVKKGIPLKSVYRELERRHFEKSQLEGKGNR